MIFFYTNPILIAAAVIPAVFLLVHVYRADKLEKEPAPLLISLVLYGIAATFIALLLERFGSWLLGRYFPENSTPYNVLMYFGVVAFSEEGAKYFLLKRRTWNSAASTASLTALCTRYLSHWALRCGKTSAMCSCTDCRPRSCAP